MKCAKFGCDNEATKGYLCCSINHGLKMVMERKQIWECMDADFSRQPWGTRDLYTVEMAEYYEQI